MVALTRSAVAEGRLVIVSGAARGVGVGICRQTLEADPKAHVLCTARKIEDANTLATELNERFGPPDRAHAFQLDVTSEASCRSLAEALRPEGTLGGSFRDSKAPLVLVNNAGVAYDLPWFPTPWPVEAAATTLDVNLFGSERLTRAMLPYLQQSEDGRAIFVSSGGGRANMARHDEKQRQHLLDENLTWKDIQKLAKKFIQEYQDAAKVAIDGVDDSDVQQLPFLSPSGLWMQSYGFSKACMGAYCAIVARRHPSLLSMTCSPGFIATDMSRSYVRYDELKTVDEGGEVIAWMSTEDKTKLESGVFYTPDKGYLGFVADLN